MAPRTKSFFEQENGSKPRPVYHSHCQQNRAPLSETSANIPPKPAIPPGIHTTAKLKAFQFVPDAGNEPVQNNVDHEHVAPDAPNDVDVDGSGEVKAASMTVTPRFLHANTFPCTPHTRLPLEDLIGDCDVTKEAAPVQESPDEHISWMPNSSCNAVTPNRKRKRARSSSPSCPTTSSQQRRAALLASGFLSVDKATPETDPAADLWRMYAGGRPDESLAALTKIAFEGSPRPLETPVRSGGFRRWVSTGNNWPVSRSKRLCPSTRANINSWQEQTAVIGPSRVAAMVQKIQESLSSQTLDKAPQLDEAAKEEMPSSSSPLPETKNERDSAAARRSPLQNRQPGVRPPSRGARPLPQAQQPVLVPAAWKPNPDRSDVVFPAAHQVPADPNLPGSTALHFQNKVPMPAYKRPTITRVPSQPRVVTTSKPPGAHVSETIDEFGDEFDLTADDLDEIMADVPIARRNPADMSSLDFPPQVVATTICDPFLDQIPQNVSLDDDDDDEFGCADIDEDDFAQADICATQVQRISPRKRQKRGSRSPRKSQLSSQPLISLGQNPPYPDESFQLQQYVVRQILDGEYLDDGGRHRPERTLLAEQLGVTRSTAITLRGSWESTPLVVDDIIHIARVPQQASVPSENASALSPATVSLPVGQILISDAESSPFLIVHPDQLLSATTVADSFDCARKAVLQNLIKATGETSKAMVYGSILHEVFQLALSADRWDAAFLHEVVEKTVGAHVEGLWELGMRDVSLAVEECMGKMSELTGWAENFIKHEPNGDSLVEGKNGEKVQMSISRLIAIEEHIWSPRFGLKGNIDATIEATLVSDQDPRRDRTRTRLILPLEVKTGRTTQSAAHQAQTALYTLLLSDRYDLDIKAGLLYYLESGVMNRVTPPLLEVRQMIQMRNRVAAFIVQARKPVEDLSGKTTRPSSQVEQVSGLPTILKNPFKCTKCYAQNACFTYHALIEDGTAESAGMIDDKRKNHSLVWKEAVGHLINAPAVSTTATSTDKAQEQMKKAKIDEAIRVDTLRRFFSKWDRLLTFEEGDQMRFRKELWTMTSADRERIGRCFGGLVIRPDSASLISGSRSSAVAALEELTNGDGSRINRFKYTFVRSTNAESGARQQRPFTEGSQLVVGEPVVVSSEKGQWALANGYVTALSKKEISVAVDRELGDARQALPGFDASNQQILHGIMTVGEQQVPVTANKEEAEHGNGSLYRLDKDEFSNGLALVRNNLLTLMSAHPVHTKLRDIIVHGTPPSFSRPPHRGSSTQHSQPRPVSEMNIDQQQAVSKVLAADDYALILGMPGTGKTTTIARIIRALREEGKSILLTSFTHTAVDNILLKLQHSNVLSQEKKDVLRLGAPSKINPQIRDFCLLASSSPPRTSIDEVEQAYMQTPIVATTCLGTTNHPIFRRRMFDVCIVDEASQITLPTILGPLLHARKFVLVGDHFQLPPLVQNPLALKGGLDESLFRMLCEREGGDMATVELGCQYRMCEEIMRLSNLLVYGGRLRCGSEAVAKRTLSLSQETKGLAWMHEQRSRAEQCQGSNCWLREASSPREKVVLVDTDYVEGDAAREVLDTSTKNLTNPAEAKICLEIILALLAQGVDGKDIGIITPYRSQLTLLRHLIRVALRVSPAQLRSATDLVSTLSLVDIDTPDRFQGRDKEVIILSLVRSNSRGEVGELLRDARRVNVALTRARSKMILLGSKSTLEKGSELLKGVVSIIEEESLANNGMSVVALPHNALTAHELGDTIASQSQTPALGQARSPPKRRAAGGTPSPQKRQAGSQKRSSPRKDVLAFPSCGGSSQGSPSKRRLGSPLKPRSPYVGTCASPAGSQKSTNAARVSKNAAKSIGPKVCAGSRNGTLSGRMKRMKEAVAVEIWEDLTAEEINEF